MKFDKLWAIICLFIVYITGMVVGCKYSQKKPEEEVISENVKVDTLPPIHDTIPHPIPYKVVYITDTVYKDVDTAQILADYFAKKKYRLDFSNDSVGVYKVNLDVSENRVINATSEIRPIRTTIETVKYIREPSKRQIYAIIGSSLDLGVNKIQIGTDLGGKYYAGASAIRVRDNVGYTVDVGIKF